MQADVILKSLPMGAPLSLSGGARVEGGGGARPPPRTPLFKKSVYVTSYTLITLSSIIENTIFLEENRNLLVVSTESTGKLFLNKTKRRHLIFLN